MDTARLKPPPGSKRFRLVAYEGVGGVLTMEWRSSFCDEEYIWVRLEYLNEDEREDAGCIAIVGWNDAWWSNGNANAEATEQIRLWREWKDAK